MHSFKKSKIDCHLEIIAQPASRYEFRYLSAGVRGPLKSCVPTTNQWPTVHLVLNEECPKNCTFNICCLLVKQDELGYYHLSANMLLKRQELLNDQSNNGVVEAEMKQLHPNRYSFELEDYYILKTEKKDIKKCLDKKVEWMYNSLNRYGRRNLYINAEREMKEYVKHDVVKLAFLAYFYDGEKYQQVDDAVYSDLIYNCNSSVRINLCCNPFIHIDGKMNLHLLLSDVNFNYKIKISTTDGSWQSKLIDPVKSLISLKSAHKMLAFEVPPYRNQFENAQTPVQCKLSLYDASDKQIEGIEADVVYVRFILSDVEEMKVDLIDDEDIYFNVDEFVVKKLQDPRVSNFVDVATREETSRSFMEEINMEFNKYQMQAGANFKELWDKVMKINETYTLLCGDKHTTVFHDAIKFGQLAELRQAFTTTVGELPSEYFKLLAKLQDGANRTVLHWLAVVPESSNTENVKWLIFKCAAPALAMLTIQGNSYLHIAVDRQNLPMLHAIRECLNDAQMKQLLSIYNMSGYTALHKSILKNNVKSFECLLEFYVELHVNACEVRTLGVGLTPMHLIAQYHPCGSLKQILLNKFKDAGSYLNYAGYEAYDQNDQTENPDQEMISKRKLKNKTEVEISDSDSIDDDDDDDDDDDAGDDHGLYRLTIFEQMAQMRVPIRPK